MFPAFFARVTQNGAPISGMIVMGVVQSAMALSTISPTLSEQFSALVNLAVVTNVIPYIIALSALIVMMQKAGVDESTYRRNVAVAVVAMLYSTYAIYASGASAVLGGTVVMAIGFVIYGFLAPRFVIAASKGAQVAAVLALVLLAAAPARAGALDRIRETGKLRLGVRSDARPFSYQDESGKAAGYSVALCQKVVDAAKAELGLAQLAAEYVQVGSEDRFEAVRQGKIDLLCGVSTATLERRKQVAFSIPIFPSGIGALMRSDAPERVKAALEGREPPYRPRWRATLAEVLEKRILSAETGTTTAAWLADRRKTLDVSAEIAPVQGFQEGVDRVLSRRSDVFFADRALLLDVAARSPSSRDLIVLDRQYTHEPIALALPRGDEDFRLLVDRALSHVFRSPEIGQIYAQSFGEPDASALAFFGFVALPD
jgi:putrescine:ornithine antiporter